MMRNKLPQALPCLQITGLAAQVAEKYGLRPRAIQRAAPRVRHALPAAHADAQPQRANVGGQVLHRVAAGQRAGALCYLTRRHIFEELTAYRAAARLRGTPVLLPADIGAAFSSALRQMRLQEKNIWISPRLNKSERLDVR